MVEALAELERARAAYASQSWVDAYEAFSAVDRSASLEAGDLELLATSAYMLGREDEYMALLERTHKAYSEASNQLRAVRSAFWIGVNFAQRGEMGRASGWLGRAQRLLDSHGPDEIERGYLLLPAIFEHEAIGDLDAAARIAGEAVAIADRHGERDLFALAAHMEGHMLVEAGRVNEGLVLLDEAMVPAAAGELSPIVTGIVYCGVILACQDAREARRAREWTGVLSEWCERQPDLIAFTGRCRVHRAELMQLAGEWSDALDEARRAHERALEAQNGAAASEAAYREGEIHRLRGDRAAAERAYEVASRGGREPQPGLALLLLAHGEDEASMAMIGRALAEATMPSERAALLPACVEIALAAGNVEEARRSALELADSIDAGDSGGLAATAAHVEGAVALADGDPTAALTALRRAARTWQDLDAPYEVARSRELAGLACRALGDELGAGLEVDAARAAYEGLGAAPDLARLAGTRPENAHGLTARELEVLGLVASGQTNKAVAAELVLSVRTVDRHLSNIYAKLGVSSRAAATAYAHERGLL